MTAIVYEFAISYVAVKAKYDPSKILTDLAYMAYTAGFRYLAFIRKKPLASPKQVLGCEVACIPLANSPFYRA